MKFFKFMKSSVNQDDGNNKSSEGVTVNQGNSTSDVKKDNNKLKLDHFVDKSLAKDYVCKICHYIVINPKEHKTGTVRTCTSLFCALCIRARVRMGQTYCPSPGCLTSGFNEDAFREIGSRDASKLNGLTMFCPYSCGLKFTYSDYIKLSHKQKCPKNPNICDICRTVKTGPTGDHDCHVVFNEMRNHIESLNQTVVKLNGVIDQLRRDLQKSKEDSKGQIGGENLMEIIENKEQQDKMNIVKVNDQRSRARTRDRSRGSRKGETQGSSNRQSKSENKTIDEVDSTIKDQKNSMTYISNNCFNKPGLAVLKLVFHYGETSFTFEDTKVSLTFRTFRSILSDTLGHDPGLMLLVQHRVLQDKDVIQMCGFRPGNNVITVIKGDTPNYSKPGYKLRLYPVFRRKPGETKQSNLISFYSNDLEPKPSANQIELTLQYENTHFKIESIRMDQTIGDIRDQAKVFLSGGPSKLIYLTHLILKDNMYISDCALQPGSTDIVLFPPNRSTKQLNGLLHLNRFLTEPKATKANSLASLIN